MVKKAFDFFVFTSLFIAACAVLMVYQTFLLFNLPQHWTLLGFVFAGSVCSYNFHWYLTPPHVDSPSAKTLWNINYKMVHLALFIAGLVASVIFAFMLLQHWFWLLVTAFLTFLYSAPKITHPLFAPLQKVAVGKTIFLAFAWTHITSLLPLLVHGETLTNAHVAFVVNRFFYLYPICIIFDRRDVEDDRKAGIKSLVTYLNDKGIDFIFWSTLAVFFISSFILLFWFDALSVAALTAPGLLLAWLYKPSKTSTSDYLYYFVLDGLMMLSAPLLILAKFVR